jgi:hypothetical protein
MVTLTSFEVTLVSESIIRKRLTPGGPGWMSVENVAVVTVAEID